MVQNVSGNSAAARTKAFMEIHKQKEDALIAKSAMELEVKSLRQQLADAHAQTAVATSHVSVSTPKADVDWRKEAESWQNAFGFKTPLDAQLFLESEARTHMEWAWNSTIDECKQLINTQLVELKKQYHVLMGKKVRPAQQQATQMDTNQSNNTHTHTPTHTNATNSTSSSNAATPTPVTATAIPPPSSRMYGYPYTPAALPPLHPAAIAAFFPSLGFLPPHIPPHHLQASFSSAAAASSAAGAAMFSSPNGPMAMTGSGSTIPAQPMLQPPANVSVAGTTPPVSVPPSTPSASAHVLASTQTHSRQPKAKVKATPLPHGASTHDESKINHQAANAAVRATTNTTTAATHNHTAHKSNTNANANANGSNTNINTNASSSPSPSLSASPSAPAATPGATVNPRKRDHPSAFSRSAPSSAAPASTSSTLPSSPLTITPPLHALQPSSNTATITPLTAAHTATPNPTSTHTPTSVSTSSSSYHLPPSNVHTQPPPLSQTAQATNGGAPAPVPAPAPATATTTAASASPPNDPALQQTNGHESAANMSTVGNVEHGSTSGPEVNTMPMEATNKKQRIV